MKQILVKDIMTTDVVTISPYAKVRALLNLMREKEVKSVIVERVNAHDAFGIVTYTNILKAIFSEDGDMDLLNVYDIYSKPVLMVSQELDIRYAARMMVQHDIKRLIVSHSNELMGLISMNDVVRILMDEAVGE